MFETTNQSLDVSTQKSGRTKVAGSYGHPTVPMGKDNSPCQTPRLEVPVANSDHSLPCFPPPFGATIKANLC